MQPNSHIQTPTPMHIAIGDARWYVEVLCDALNHIANV